MDNVSFTPRRSQVRVLLGPFLNLKYYKEGNKRKEDGMEEED